MDKDTLIIANELDARIEKLKAILECFEWNPEDDLGTDEKHTKAVTKNPEIVIEYDDFEEGNGRLLIKLPKKYSATLIPSIRKEISSEIESCKKEFNRL